MPSKIFNGMSNEIVGEPIANFDSAAQNLASNRPQSGDGSGQQSIRMVSDGSRPERAMQAVGSHIAENVATSQGRICVENSTEAIAMVEDTSNVSAVSANTAGDAVAAAEEPGRSISVKRRASEPAKASSAPKKRVVLRHLLSVGSKDSSPDITGTTIGAQDINPAANGQSSSLAIQVPVVGTSSTNSSSANSPTTEQMGRILCQSVGTGIALSKDESHASRYEAATQAAKSAVSDALSKASLHLTGRDDNRCLISIQLGVPAILLDASPYIDISASIIPPNFHPVALKAGVGGMYVPSATNDGNNTPSTMIIVAFATIASPVVSAGADEATPSKEDLLLRLNEAESEINTLKSLLGQKSNEVQSLNAMAAAVGQLAQLGASPPATMATTSNPWTNPFQQHTTDKTEAASEKLTTGCNTSSIPSAAPVHIPDLSHISGPFHVGNTSSSSLPVAAASSTSSSESTSLLNQNCDSKKLDQLVEALDKEEEKDVERNYHDYASLSSEFLKEQKNMCQTELMISSKRAMSFPIKIMVMLEDVHLRQKTDIVAWMPHGRAFKVFDHDRFEAEILPAYMDSSKYCSFLRQLNLYGFKRFCGGVDKNAYYHEKFLRGMPWIAGTIQRTKINGRKHRTAGDPEAEPKLYTYSHLGAPGSTSSYWKLHSALAEATAHKGDK